MYGFGDVPNPASDSIAVMDDLVINYITEMVRMVWGAEYTTLTDHELVSRGGQSRRTPWQSPCRGFQVHSKKGQEKDWSC